MRTGSTPEQDALVAKELHCFPLAIVQMAGVCLLRNWSPDEFLRRYDNDMERHKLHDVENPFAGSYLRTLASIWSLHNFQESPRSVLSILALLDPENIREDILTTKPELAQLPGFPTDSTRLKNS